MKICISFLIVLMWITQLSIAQNQTPQTPNTPRSATDIYNDLQKLNFLGSVLYVAAHPDDENNKMLAYLENHVHAQTAYLSLTRGDGGQNLIGPEIRELLGVIRTQEMMAARRIDGAEQYFSRANDFGFSKNPDETLSIWDKELILEDVVWTIRNFKPDIIINRFDHRNPGTTHGHHTAASILSLEAFDLAAQETVYPLQLNSVNTHQTQYAYFNTSPRFYKDENAFEEVRNTFYTVDVGVYYPGYGQSNTEIAALSRSEHQCQGMGTTPTRGSLVEYLELLKGKPANQDNIFSGINTTWSRIEGGKAISEILYALEENFDFKNPSTSVPQLVKAYQLIEDLPVSHWKAIKSKAIKELIVQCAGLFFDASTTTASACAMDSLSINIEAVNRSDQKIQLKNWMLSTETNSISDFASISLENNQPYKSAKTVILPKDIKPTNAYWLNEEASLGTYKVTDQQLRGLPETPRSLSVQFRFEVLGTEIVMEKNLSQKYTDVVKGEVRHPFEIVPKAMVNLSSNVYLFNEDTPQKIVIEVRSEKDNLSGTLYPGQAEGWKVVPEKIDIQIDQKGATQSFTFELYPPKTQSNAELKPYIKVDDKIYDRSFHQIEYGHIPRQIVLLPAKAKTVKLDIETAGKNIGYIMGAGDVLPENLKQVGYTVTLLDDSQITTKELQKFNAIVLGVRAYNVSKNLVFKQQALMDYLKTGGTLIVQYNTSHRLLLEDIGPYPMKLSRDRVTDETADVQILQPDHPLMNYPNKITAADFEGWVQERGLYFPNEWDDNYDILLSAHDQGEPPRNGGLLYAEYGEGTFIYTGYSWFRQLPVGVPGAYRLFANLLAGGKKEH